MTRLHYRGRGLDTLHSDYAMRGRIDSSAPVAAHREILIAAPVETVWELLADPSGWHGIDPAIHDVHLDGEIAPGTSFTWRNGMARMTSRFAIVDPGREISWTGESAGIKAVHRHLFAGTDGSNTFLVSEESMDGFLLPLYYSSKKLGRTLEGWLAALGIRESAC
jgi:uncharacterized protein YndB with AHSA1/START domain